MLRILSEYYYLNAQTWVSLPFIEARIASSVGSFHFFFLVLDFSKDCAGVSFSATGFGGSGGGFGAICLGGGRGTEEDRIEPTADAVELFFEITLSALFMRLPSRLRTGSIGFISISVVRESPPTGRPPGGFLRRFLQTQ